MDLVISKAHTSRATRDNAIRCPAARAFKAAGFEAVRVDGINMYYVVNDKYKKVKLPGTLSDAIAKFDNGGEFKIGTFRIAGLKRPVKSGK